MREDEVEEPREEMIPLGEAAEGRELVVVGSGPNGLAAAIEMARAGFSVTVVEAAEAVGGGARTGELTLPGYLHDICSAVHPLGASSPFFNSLPLARHGLQWVYPPISLAHPFDDGGAAALVKEIDGTAESLDLPDKRSYMRLMAPLRDTWEELAPDLLAPLHFPLHPVAVARFGLHAVRSATGLATGVFSGERARALFAGLAAHSFLPLERPATAAFSLVLGILGHVTGWPVAAGGSGRISAALASYLLSLGGKIITGVPVRSTDQFPDATPLILDVTPRQLLRIAGPRLSPGYRRELAKYRYGPGVFKMDWALAGPIPWRAEACRRAGTVHVGGTLAEIAKAERGVWEGKHPERPFVLVAQQSLFDPGRAPAGKHTGWAYCHVPNGSHFDMSERIERQIERFAPGFGDLVVARHTRDTGGLETYNENCVGGDINGGVQDLRRMFFRPVVSTNPYATSNKNIYLCSSSTPPGGGVHGMCGFHAARAAIEGLKRK